ASSRWPSAPGSEEDPAWTTMRRAREICSRAVLMPGSSSFHVLVVRGGVDPVSRITLGPQLLARRRLRVHALLERLAALRARGAVTALVLLDAQVGAATAQELFAGGHGRLPVVDDPAVQRADDDHRARHGARLEQ